ncbi:RteC domain-containing protein [Galbibacter pacificus]|uniref:RteC domain-containing protein n=1 Tax=Galbibacter pacificus TaxID=2996052 RepID=A0ABT6FN73_9FLAO|nr:RteC domain-containing protein [Galbibacter pacificus]MDG3581239.1 RteC domain-containing protein [Galbibacter pacificus]MDG3584717.1 RteC domain-containing protein [Galbibacter pacificus]
MNDYEKLLNELENQLNQMEINENDVLIRAEKGIQITKGIVGRIRRMVLERDFVNKAEEKDFFRRIKPRAVSRFICYTKLYDLESKRPMSSSKLQKRYLQHAIKELQSYFTDNIEFYNYYRRGATIFDDVFFLRNKSNIRMAPDALGSFMDSEFSTSHDNVVAIILGHDMLIDYLKKEMKKIRATNRTQLASTSLPDLRLSWTASKAALTELIYALYSSGVFNHGRKDLKGITAAFERLFDIRMDTVYKSYSDIKARKGNRARFLQELIDRFNDRMDADDAL